MQLCVMLKPMRVLSFMTTVYLLHVPKSYVHSKFFTIIVTPSLVGSYLELSKGLRDLADCSGP